MSLPDYVLSEDEDRARTRVINPSLIGPWAYGVSQMAALTEKQCAELRHLGIDPGTVDWMWVTVPLTDKFPVPATHGRAVQRLACPIIRTVGQKIQVITPKGDRQTIYAGGRLSPPKVHAKRRLRSA